MRDWFDAHLQDRGRWLGIALVGIAMSGPAQAADAADPTGVWLVQDGIARVRIEKCVPQGAELCGYAVWLEKPLDDLGQPRRDTQNPDPSRKGQPILGHQNLMGLKPTVANAWEGKVYNAENGRFYDVTVTAFPADARKLAIRGCMLGVLCGSQAWTRVTDIAPGQIPGPEAAVKDDKVNAISRKARPGRE